MINSDDARGVLPIAGPAQEEDKPMTNYMNRRALLQSATALGTALALAACSTTPQQNLQTAARIAAAIAAGVKALVPALTALGLSPEASAQVTKYAGVVATIAAQIEANPGSTTATQLQQVEDAVNQIIAIAATIQALPAQVQAVLGALAVALPMLEAAIGILLPPAPTPAPAVAGRIGAFHATFVGTGGSVINILNGAPNVLARYRR